MVIFADGADQVQRFCRLTCGYGFRARALRAPPWPV